MRPALAQRWIVFTWTPSATAASLAETAVLVGSPLPRIGEERALGRPLLVGPSRKSFIGWISGAPVGGPLPGTLAAVAACVLGGVEIVRVHDVAAARQTALVAAALRDSGRPAGAPA